jgi:1-acylglycerone phosphate reductase
MADLEGIPGITLVQLDVTSIDSIRHAKDQVASVLGDEIGLDILVNNAGVTATVAALDQDLAEMKQMFETNVFGIMAMVQEFMPLLMLSQDASIVNVGSFVALIPFPFGSSYSATKAAVHSYSDALRLGTLLILSSDRLSLFFSRLLELRPLGYVNPTIWQPTRYN